MGINYVNETIDHDPELLDIIKRQERITGKKARVQYPKLSKEDFEAKYGKDEIAQEKETVEEEKKTAFKFGPEGSVEAQTFDEAEYDKETAEIRARKREVRRSFFEKCETKLNEE